MGLFKRMGGAGNTNSSMTIENLDVVLNDLQKIARSVRNPKQRREVLQSAAQVIAETAQQYTPLGKPRDRNSKFKRESPPIKLKPTIKYTYKKSLTRSGKGKGTISGQYGIGNLRESIQVITKIKAPVGIVGPLRNKKTKIMKPSKRNSNGWYAAMVYGSAEAFGKIVTQRALLLKSQVVYNMIANKIIYTINQAKKGTRIK